MRSQLENNKKQPDIRFSGFSGDWEETFLGNIIDISSASRVFREQWQSSGVAFFRTSDVVSRFKNEKNEAVFISLELFEELSTKSGKVQKDDLLVTGGGSIGIPYLVDNSEPLYFKDADLLWLKSSGILNGYFLYSYFLTKKFKEFITSISHTGTISHYTIKQAKNTPITVISKKEQTSIGNFFQQLDDSIALHKRKHQQTQQLKKAMLTKLFPKKGQNQPEIRLQGFSGDWVVKRLGDIAEFLKGQSLSKSDIKHRAENPCIHYGELFTDYGRCIDKVKSYTELEPKNSITSLVNDILMPTSDVTPNGLAKASAIDFKNVILGGDILIIRSDHILNKFFAYFVEGHQKEIIELVTGTTVFHIYGKDMSKFTISLPKNYAEQTAIGNFFKQLDDTLALQTQQINTLENLKKAFLQKMFV